MSTYLIVKVSTNEYVKSLDPTELTTDEKEAVTTFIDKEDAIDCANQLSIDNDEAFEAREVNDKK